MLHWKHPDSLKKPEKKLYWSGPWVFSRRKHLKCTWQVLIHRDYFLGKYIKHKSIRANILKLFVQGTPLDGKAHGLTIIILLNIYIFHRIIKQSNDSNVKYLLVTKSQLLLIFCTVLSIIIRNSKKMLKLIVTENESMIVFLPCSMDSLIRDIKPLGFYESVWKIPDRKS